jgi:hypothetical protein
MLRTVFMLAGLAVLVGFAAPAQAGSCEGCDAVAQSGHGFCSACGKGKAYGVDLASQKLFAALTGKEIDASKVQCSGCKEAASSNGWCSACKAGVVSGKLYASPVAYALAKGVALAAEKVADLGKHCATCKSAYAANGACEACKVGFVAGRAYHESGEHKSALAAYQTLQKAAGNKCEACAVAMVTDGTCAHCKVTFKDGQVATSGK